MVWSMCKKIIWRQVVNILNTLNLVLLCVGYYSFMCISVQLNKFHFIEVNTLMGLSTFLVKDLLYCFCIWLCFLLFFFFIFLGDRFFLIRVIEIFCSWPNWQSKIMTLDYPLPEYSLNLHSYALCNGNNCYCYSSKTISDRYWTFTNVSRLIYSRWKISWPPPAVIYSPWMF